MTEIHTIELEGKQYPVDNFSPTVVRLLDLGVKWTADLEAARARVLMAECALESLNTELKQTVKAELLQQEQVIDLSPRFTETV